MRIYSKTDKGCVRETNQDAFAAGELKNGMVWAVVCDGMGGANGGEIAGSTAVKTVSDYILNSYHSKMSQSSIKTMMASAVETANIELYDLAQKDKGLKGMGTTVVAVLIENGTAHIVHAGDSRAYLIRGGTGMQLTRDHSVVQNMVENGQITEDEARIHPRKNVITRALGVAENIDSDYDKITLIKDDVLLLCTDGLTNFVQHKEIESIILTEPLNEVPTRLVEEAIKNGGGDNITAVVIS